MKTISTIIFLSICLYNTVIGQHSGNQKVKGMLSKTAIFIEPLYRLQKFNTSSSELITFSPLSRPGIDIGMGISYRNIPIFKYNYFIPISDKNEKSGPVIVSSPKSPFRSALSVSTYFLFDLAKSDKKFFRSVLFLLSSYEYRKYKFYGITEGIGDFPLIFRQNSNVETFMEKEPFLANCSYEGINHRFNLSITDMIRYIKHNDLSDQRVFGFALNFGWYNNNFKGITDNGDFLEKEVLSGVEYNSLYLNNYKNSGFLVGVGFDYLVNLSFTYYLSNRISISDSDGLSIFENQISKIGNDKLKVSGRGLSIGARMPLSNNFLFFIEYYQEGINEISYEGSKLTKFDFRNASSVQVLVSESKSKFEDEDALYNFGFGHANYNVGIRYSISLNKKMKKK